MSFDRSEVSSFRLAIATSLQANWKLFLVEGIILVGGYSGIAKKQINELKMTFPHLIVKQFTNKI